MRLYMPLAEIVGISDDFIKIMKLLSKGKTMADVYQKFEDLNTGFSMQTQRAFRDIFFPKK